MSTTVLNTKSSEAGNKIPETSSLVTITVLHTKISEVENKIPDYAKYITTHELNKSTADNFKERLKQANLVRKPDVDKKLISFNRKITSNKTKYLKLKKKLSSTTIKDFKFFIGKICFKSNDWSQNMFVYQPTLDTLELKKGTDDVISWKSKGVYNSKLKPLYTSFLHNIKNSGYRTGIEFDKDNLAAEQNNYVTKIENLYIAYDLDNWPRDPTKNFKFKNCLFGATSVVKNSDIEKYVYSGYGAKFNIVGFGVLITTLLEIFGIDNSSSSPAKNCKNNFSVPGEGPTFVINGSFCLPDKNFSINFSKANTKS